MVLNLFRTGIHPPVALAELVDPFGVDIGGTQGRQSGR